MGKQETVGRLTAAVLIRAVGAVGLFVALVTGRDAGSVAQAFELLGSTSVTGPPGGCTHGRESPSTGRSGRPNAALCCCCCHVRQLASSELSSQSLSPSQRHSLRAQRPFLHLNSLGSQGDGVPAGETTVIIQPRVALRRRPQLPVSYRIGTRHFRPSSPARRRRCSRAGCTLRSGRWPDPPCRAPVVPGTPRASWQGRLWWERW